MPGLRFLPYGTMSPLGLDRLDHQRLEMTNTIA